MHGALHILPHVALMMPLEPTSTYSGTTVQPDAFTSFSNLQVVLRFVACVRFCEVLFPWGCELNPYNLHEFVREYESIRLGLGLGLGLDLYFAFSDAE